MQWFTMLNALFLLLLLALKFRRPPRRFVSALQTGETHTARLADAAKQAGGIKGFARLRLSRFQRLSLQRKLTSLQRIPPDNRTPCVRMLCEHSRFLMEEAYQSTKGIPRLPCTVTKQLRVCLFAQVLTEHAQTPLTCAGIRQALQIWQAQQPFTTAELEAVQAAVRISLIEQLIMLSKSCQDDAKAAVAIASLRAIESFPWNELLEEASMQHSLFNQDPVYAAMTPESRAHYRRQAAKIARHTRLSEKRIASGVMALCQQAEPETIVAHAGYYLLDDGYAKLLEHLQSMTAANRVRCFCRKNTLFLRRLSGWGLFALLLLAAWLVKLPVLFWFAFALAGLTPFFHAHSCHFTPRIHLERLSDDDATLVVCAAQLSSVSQAIQAVKSMAVMQLANPDPSLHFLLLGHFPPTLLRTEDSDTQIISAATEAVNALCESTGHAFFYLQRERTHAGADDVLHTVLTFTAGDPAQLRLSHASADVHLFHHHYRYVILIDPDTMLPPGSALKMIGTMLHPLYKRQKHDHRMRGFSILQPELFPALHAQESRFAGFGLPIFPPHVPLRSGVIDPYALLEDVQRTKTGAIPLSSCSHLSDALLFVRPPQTLHAFLRIRYRQFCTLIKTVHLDTDAASRQILWTGLSAAFGAPVHLALIICAAAYGKWWLWVAAMLIPALLMRSLRGIAMQTLLLPCSAYTALSALIRTLYERLTGRKLPVFRGSPADGGEYPAVHPPMLFFTIFMSCAALFAALSFAPAASQLLCWFHAALWALFACVLPELEQPRAVSTQPTSYMREVLLRIAQRTLTYFETAMTESDHALPTSNVQIDPNKGIDHSTAPDTIGLYLCALLGICRIGLLPAKEALTRINACISTLETLARWKGLFFDCYDTRTLAPFQTQHVTTRPNGILAVSLLTCAQGVRTLLPTAGEDFSELATRLDQLAQQMQLDALYDHSANLFFAGFDPMDEKPDSAHETLLASQSRLASYAAVILGQIPPDHFQHLSRRTGEGAALASPTGSAADYLLPALFHPLIRKTALGQSCRQFIRLQRRHRRGGVYGLSESACYAFDMEMRYQVRSFGISALAQDSLVEDSSITPYASMLMLPLDLKNAFVNLNKLLVLGMEGPLGLFEAVDFSISRTGDQRTRIIRSHNGKHQAIILCAIANALSQEYLASLFFNLPRAQAYRLLLEEPALPVRKRHRFRFPAHEEQLAPAPQLDRTAHPLRFPIDAHLLHGHHTTWLIDAQGGGCLMYHQMPATHFDERCCQPCGIRIYLRDSQNGVSWTATDPYLLRSVRYETHQAVFSHTHLEIACEMRLWINPLDGSAVHFLTIENQSEANRVLEICSYVEPAYQQGAMQSRRICRCGVQGQYGAHTWQHLLTSDTQPSLTRIQCDQSAFIGRGRSFLAPRAMDHPAGAVPDLLGKQNNPCLSLRSQFAVPAGQSIRVAFITQITDENESCSAFCDRYQDMAAVERCRDAAATAANAAMRFWGMDTDDLALCSHLTGALAYRAQPFQQAQTRDSVLPINALEQYGFSIGQRMLVVECPPDTLRQTVSILLKAHAFFQAYGFPFALVFVLRIRTRASAVRDLVEEEMESCLGGRQNVHLIERADEDEAALLRAAARLVLQADQDILSQLDRLTEDIDTKPIYLCQPSKTHLPDGQPTLLSNTFGGFVPSDGSYQITLAPGRNTPSPWRNAIGSTTSDESGLHGGEAFFLRDEDERLLWSPTRQPLGHAFEVRTTHAPGETTYESSAHGVYARISCFGCVDDSAQIRLFYIHNEAKTPRTIRLFHKLPFGLAQLQVHHSAISGWDPMANRHVSLFSTEADCECAVTSEGGFHGLWGLAPHALAVHEVLPSPGGNTAVLSFSLQLPPGGHVTLASAAAHAQTAKELEALVKKIRSTSANDHLRRLRQYWEERLTVFSFDLPDPAVSLLFNRWIPCQYLNEGTGLLALFPMVYTAPDRMKRLLQDCSRLRDRGNLYEQLLLPYLCTRCAVITGDYSFMTGDLLERCIRNLRDVTFGTHGMPVEAQESVWLGMLMCEAIRMLLPFCTGNDRTFLEEQRNSLLKSIDHFAWDGGWYVTGWDQEKSGIDLAVQSWAVLCGASRERCEIAMENAWRMLHEPTAKQPVHTLTAFWAVCAFHQLGQTERAWHLAFSLLPIAHSSTRQLAVRYQAEPYVLAMEIDPNGRGSSTWFSEGAGWCWCMWLEQLLGFRLTGSMLRFNPVVPDGWNSLRITLRFGSSTYHLHADRDTPLPAAHGQPLPDGRMNLIDDGRIHEAFFPLR